MNIKDKLAEGNTIPHNWRMSDPSDPTHPRQTADDAQTRPGQKRRRPPVPGAMSRESRFVGYLVLGFGFLAILAVLIIALGGESDVETNATPRDPALAASLQTDIEKNEPEARSDTPPTPSEKLVLDRQRNLNASKIEGSWQANIGPYVGVAQMEKGSYQVILAEPGTERARLYSSGVYRIVDDMLMFTPRLDWGAPKVPKGSNFRYQRMTAGRSSMIVGFHDGAMVWQHVPRDEQRERPHNRSAVILQGDLPYIVWKKVK